MTFYTQISSSYATYITRWMEAYYLRCQQCASQPAELDITAQAWPEFPQGETQTPAW